MSQTELSDYQNMKQITMEIFHIPVLQRIQKTGYEIKKIIFNAWFKKYNFEI